ARRIHQTTALLASALEKAGVRASRASFDTLTVEVPDAEAVHRRAEAAGVLLRRIDSRRVGISVGEGVGITECEQVLGAISGGGGTLRAHEILSGESAIPAACSRTSPFSQDPVFNQHHSETELVRYLKRLESRDLSLRDSMIPLGSCTMKLNAAA